MKIWIIIAAVVLMVKGLSLGAAALFAATQGDSKRMTRKDWVEALSIMVVFLLFFSFLDMFVGATLLKLIFAGG